MGNLMMRSSMVKIVELTGEWITKAGMQNGSQKAPVGIAGGECRCLRFQCALTYRFKQANTRSDRDVEGRNGTGHRNADQFVAVLTRQTAHAFAFGTHHQRHWA